MLTKAIKSQLVGFEEVKMKNVPSIQIGDFMKYFVNNELKYGGTVKLNKYDKYIVLANYAKRVTWCVQLTEPGLRIFIKRKAVIDKERAQKKTIKEKLYREYIQNNR